MLLFFGPGENFLENYLRKGFSRIVFLFVLGTANLSLCLYFAVYNAAYASNYLLALFMGNLFLYLNFYVFMKLYCGERPTWSCLIYAALLHLTSIPSLYFFLQVFKLLS